MIGHLAYAHGAPCPTLVLDRRSLPTGDDELRAVLAAARSWLVDVGAADVMKIALIAPSTHPLFDLDYKFVQVLPGERFDLGGSCGHSILSSIMAANQLGWLATLAPGTRVRVHVLNTADNIVCEVDEVNRTTATFTVHFLQYPPVRLGDLLIAKSSRVRLTTGDADVSASLVSAGNPYVFVDAAEVGVPDRDRLFADDRDLYERLAAIRIAGARYLGHVTDGAFPKIAAVGQYDDRRLAVRALSVPSWHPTLALTGAACIAAAAAIDGTIPHELAQQAGSHPDRLVIDTAGGTTTVSASVSGSGLDDSLSWTSVATRSCTSAVQWAWNRCETRFSRR
jgi:2-methylaconitate cis-trans-isomerase PrpF